MSRISNAQVWQVLLGIVGLLIVGVVCLHSLPTTPLLGADSDPVYDHSPAAVTGTESHSGNLAYGHIIVSGPGIREYGIGIRDRDDNRTTPIALLHKTTTLHWSCNSGAKPPHDPISGEEQVHQALTELRGKFYDFTISYDNRQTETPIALMIVFNLSC